MKKTKKKTTTTTRRVIKQTTQNTFKYGKQAINIIGSSHPLTPREAIEVTLSSEDKNALGIALNNNIATLLVGETGTGKSSAVKYLAFKRQQPYVRANMNGYTTPDELVGRMGVKDGKTYFEDGIITSAMKLGAILVLDEVNGTTQDCLFVIHGLLDEDKRITLPNGDIVEPHPDFRVFATCNPDYEGTRTMNKAFIDRFGLILSIDTLAPAKEQDLLIERTGVTGDQAQALVTMATMARKDYLENKLSIYVSTRALISVGRLVSQGLELDQAYKMTIERKTTNKDEQRALHDVFLAVMKYADKTGEQALDMPIVTTKRELEEYKELAHKANDTVLDAISKYNTAAGERDAWEGKARLLNKTLEEKAKEFEQTLIDKKELESQLKGYKKLDEIIRMASGKTNIEQAPVTALVPDADEISTYPAKA